MKLPVPTAAVLQAALILAPVWAFATDTERASVDAAHHELGRRFISPHGTIYDYAGLNGEVKVPTAAEVAALQPNALGWGTPIENGAFFGGLYLDALCNRWKVTREPAVARRAEQIANGLLRLSEAGKTPGFIARGIADDDVSCYPASSSDQTYPWFYGLYRYAISGLPSAEQRARVVAAMDRVARGLEANHWEMPIDRPHFGHFGHWLMGFAGTKGILVGAEPQFDAATRLLFVLRALHHLTGDTRWLQLYRDRLGEKPAGSEWTRLEICAQGVEYVAPGDPPQFPERPRLWTSASSQAGLRALHDWEDDPAARAAFRRGLDANARRAAPYISGYAAYPNENSLAFDVQWRSMNTLWKPQTIISEAVELGRSQKGETGPWGRQSPRFAMESLRLRDPLFAAWVVTLSGNAEIVAPVRGQIRGALTHFAWDRLYTSTFFMAECVYWQLQHSGR
ncbi:MAG: hypothetical protein U1F61_11510 [Opitutaceae bacterium]